MKALFWNGNGIQTKLLWGAIAALGAVSLGIVALSRGEPVNAAWLVIAAVCIYFIAYRYLRAVHRQQSARRQFRPADAGRPSQ